jgi:hypothetical protein
VAHGLIACHASGSALALLPRGTREPWLCRSRSVARLTGCHQHLQRHVPTAQDALQGLAQVDEHVESIRHLLRVRRALADALCIRARPVTRDDLDAGMGAEPGRERPIRAVRQQIEDLVPLMSDQDRAIGPAPA